MSNVFIKEKNANSKLSSQIHAGDYFYIDRVSSEEFVSLDLCNAPEKRLKVAATSPNQQKG